MEVNRDLESYISDCIKKARKWRNMTQSEVASASGLKQSTYSNYENGIRQIKVSTLLKIADTLDLPIQDILDQSYERGMELNDLEKKEVKKFLKQEKVSPTIKFILQRCLTETENEMEIKVIKKAHEIIETVCPGYFEYPF